MGNQLIKEQIIEILESDYCDGGPTLGSIADKIENLVNQEAERRIKERMLSDEDIIDFALFYVNHKSLLPANKGLIKDAIIIGMKELCSRLTNPGEQKTEGGGE